MSLFHQIRRFCFTIILTIIVAITIAFDFETANSWAVPSSLSSLSQPQHQIAWGWGRAKAVTKDIEGKTQETIGNITGNRKDQMMGKIKQTESQILNAVEDTKDSMRLQERTKAVTKSVEGKAQEAVGNITGNRKDQMMGKVKQAEGQMRNAVGDMKDNLQDIFN